VLGCIAVIVCTVGLLGPAWFGFWDNVGGRVGPVAAWVAGLFNDAAEKWLKQDHGNDAATAACVVIACVALYMIFMTVWQHRATKRGNRVLSG
jgi:hypothetical protein